MIRYWIPIIVCSIIMAGCSALFSRSGYKIRDYDNISDCNIPIKENFFYEEEEIEKLGRIRAYSSGISVKCHEGFVLETFRKDGCYLGADLINIIKESPPNLWDSCYGATAEFIRFKNRDIVISIESDPKYSPSLVQFRSQKTIDSKKRAIGAGIDGGTMGGMSVPSK